MSARPTEVRWAIYTAAWAAIALVLFVRLHELVGVIGASLSILGALCTIAARLPGTQP